MEKIRELSEEIKKFRLCSLTADPDEQTALTYGFKHLAKKFVNFTRKIEDTGIQQMISNLDCNIERMDEAYDLKIDLECLIDSINELNFEEKLYITPKEIVGLKELICDVLWEEKSYNLPMVCKSLGLQSGEEAEAGASKRVYVSKRLASLSSLEIFRLAEKVNERYESKDLSELVINISNKDGLGVITNFEEIQSVILSEIKEAKFTIWAAIAWLTDKEIANQLYLKKKDGVNIQLVITDTDINRKLEQNGAKLEDYFEVYRIPEKVLLMHNKFCVIDLKKVIHGSYNWTTKAQFNKETITLIENRAAEEEFAKEFIRLKNIVKRRG